MKTWTRLLFCASALATAAVAAPAAAAGLDETVTFKIAPGRLDEALISYASQADLQVISASSDLRGKQTQGVDGATTPREALAMLLRDSGLSFTPTGASTVTVTQGEQAGGGNSADGTVEALIVTAQKKEEDIQDVPIAISAFTQKDLEQQKIEGGFDLLKAIPNVTFSKNNFTGYNFSIRGIGTKAVSVTTDPGVAVAFNSAPLLRNRLFEQEYFDIERVEVLRGPQGTLYGRNATAGVVNVISAKPVFTDFEGSIKGEVGNYNTRRLVGMVNIPVYEDRLAIRLAGAATQRDGYDFNATTKNAINGRDLWSGRLSIGFEPTDTVRADFIWEHFSEDDNRSRTGKQLCHRDDGPETLGALTDLKPLTRGVLSQGCKAGSMYDDAAFGTPNGLSIPFVLMMAGGTGDAFGRTVLGYDPSVLNPDGSLVSPGMIHTGIVRALAPVDPYGGMMQSRDLRVINSVKDPIYRAKADILQLNVAFDLGDTLTLVSQTGYNKDEVYSFQDYNRFNTVPIFNNSAGLNTLSYLDYDIERGPIYEFVPGRYPNLTPGGVFCDPQLGCSDTLAGFDISQAKSTQFSQEFRMTSNFDGPLNFNAGVNYIQFKTLEDYYVMYNLLTMLATQFFNDSDDPNVCVSPIGFGGECVYVDPNPVESINGEGHNYFRSKNPYRLKSASAFGEVYWDISETLRMTLGLRYTDDRKTTIPVPTQALLAPGLAAGTVARGYPEGPEIKQRWGEWSGRFGLDWKPDLAATDETLLYAMFSRGYKGGGANPPGIGFDPAPLYPGGPPIAATLPFPQTFEPEFVNAYEIGAKNTLFGGALTVNAAAFYYDYTNYQVSKIVDRSAANENFDAKVWGLELESLWYASRDLRFNAAIGYQDTAIGKGEQSLDLMDRTQGNPDWVVVKPFVQLASNCVAPRAIVENLIQKNREDWAWVGADEFFEYGGVMQLCGGSWLSNNPDYDSFRDGPNFGQGFYDDISGNELPNAPHWTVSIGGQYSWDFLEGWRGTVRADGYWQSQSWARVYNSDPYDKLHGWYNANLSIWIENDNDLKIELYAKNLLDKTPITDAFLNSDDTSLTTNVFVLDPRLIGLSVRKGF